MARESERRSSVAPRFPEWLRKRIPAGGAGASVREILSDLGLETVCSRAHCPNLCECYARGTATFLILGSICTRACRFCAVQHGHPAPPDPGEPERVAEAAQRMGLRYVVITSVTRDDLPDGGADHFRRTIEAVRAETGAPVEVLTPDFQGDLACVATVAAARPAVYNHNVETVPRLYPTVRPEADYRRSLNVLRAVSDRHPGVCTKSGIMVGLGERPEEVEAVLRDLVEAGCRLVTIGQYLQPSPRHAAVAEFVRPEAFQEYADRATRLGLLAAAGPFVRSSYRAATLAEALRPLARETRHAH